MQVTLPGKDLCQRKGCRRQNRRCCRARWRLWHASWSDTRWRPWLWVLAAVGGLVVSHDHLRFHTNRDDVLNPSSDYNRRWLQYTKEFGDEEDVVVVVEGAGREAVVLVPTFGRDDPA